jgi:hypothetical protein
MTFKHQKRVKGLNMFLLDAPQYARASNPCTLLLSMELVFSSL